MNIICNEDLCTGCLACYNACHKGAISCKSNEEGFIHPVIDVDLCVKCGICQKVCPVNTKVKLKESISIYSGWSKDNNIRIKSSSGGAFTEIAKIIIAKHGVVFGCKFNKRIEAIHSYVETTEELNSFRGSKYVQSYIGTSYRDAESFLKSNRIVLFSGTSCQIAGLRNYLRKDYDNLITIDFVCHGVPSPLIFEDYKKFVCETENFKKIIDYNFRLKEPNWMYFGFRITGVNDTNNPIVYSKNHFNDPYYNGFMRNLYLRTNCYSCAYANINRISDFTIADWWGYKKQTEQDAHYSKKGVSLVMANTFKAKNLVQNLDMHLTERTFEEAIKSNPSLSAPFTQPKDRVDFWKFYHNHQFKDVVSKFLYPRKVSFGVWYLCRFCDNNFAITLFMQLYRIAKLPYNIYHKLIK